MNHNHEKEKTFARREVKKIAELRVVWRVVYFKSTHQNSKSLVESYHQSRQRWEKKKVELDVIVYADTVVNPRTVMIKSFNAPVADSTMSAATCSYRLTIRTQLWIFDC